MLLLFDIDGTLVRGRPLTHQAALTEATVEVFGLRVEPGREPIAEVQPWGKTDRQIVRDVLLAAGLASPGADEVARWERAATLAYERLETERDGRSEHGVTADALARLRSGGHRLALVTGNLEPIARRKLAMRGLDGFFPRGQGGFGSDADLRPELVPLARARAAVDGVPHPRGDTVLIGDTPRDVEAALADELRCVAITGARYDARALRAAGASATIDAVAELEGVLAGM
jgi:phosphoglycolate phosphatase